MTHDFDTPLVLRGTHCSKYDGIPIVFGTEDPDVIPMWVADMDFATAPAILAAIRAEVDRGYMGYYADLDSGKSALRTWLSERHGWDVAPEAIRFNTGVMGGFADTLEALCEPGDGVIVFTPVYQEFRAKTEALGRKLVMSPLKVKNGKHVFDLDELAGRLTGRERILTLCSPHNPGGRIWSGDEIREIARFCIEHDLVLVADEIHMDLVHPGAKATPAAVAAPEIKDRLVVITAATKAFNLAGLKTGILIVPGTELRAKVDSAMAARSGSPNRIGMAAMKAAYREAGAWQDDLRAYLAENFAIWRDRIGSIPGVSVLDMQATYLSWVDFTGTGLSDADLMSRLLNEARVAPSPGPQFGPDGTGHMRFNLALPRPTLMTAIERIETAFGQGG